MSKEYYLSKKEFNLAYSLFLSRTEFIHKHANKMKLSAEAWDKINSAEYSILADKIQDPKNKNYHCSDEELDLIKAWYVEKFVKFAEPYKKADSKISPECCLDFMCRDLVTKLYNAYPRVEDVKSVKEEEVKKEVKVESLYLNEISIKDTLDYLSNLKKLDFDSLIKDGLVSIINDQIIIVTDKYFRDGKCLLSKSETEEAFVLEKELTTKYVETKFVKKYFDPQENLINKARDIRRKMKESTDTVELSELTIELNNVYDELSHLNKEINKYVR